MTEVGPAGWYPDETGTIRWWDGSHWTDDRPPAPPTPSPAKGGRDDEGSIASPIDSITSEGDKVDSKLGIVADVVALLVGSGAASIWSPEVANAAREGWIPVFFATLTLSLSVAITVFVGVSGRAEGFQLLQVAFISLVASSGIAWMLGTGYMEIPAPQGHWIWTLIRAAGVALKTYGVVGAVLGSAVGIWIGFRAASRFPARESR